MKNMIMLSTGCLSLLLLGSPIGFAQEKGQQRGHQRMMMPRVPADKLEEARALQNPVPFSQEVLEKGKVIYEGKGTCINCHGASGHGDGPAAAVMNPPPRAFRSHGFWRHRSEGEIFWVIKHGSPGTAMIPFGGMLTDEEIWTVIHYERSFAGGPRGDGGPGHERGRGGRHGGAGMMPHRGGDQGSQTERMGHGGRRGGSGGTALDKPAEQNSTEKERETAEQAKSAALSITQAIAKATQEVAGTVVEAEFEIEGERMYWEVEIATDDGKMMEVKVDSQTGEILSTEEEQPENEHSLKSSHATENHNGMKDDHDCCEGQGEQRRGMGGGGMKGPMDHMKGPMDHMKE
jgi:mono/diheme cytochrome c family protein